MPARPEVHAGVAERERAGFPRRGAAEWLPAALLLVALALVWTWWAWRQGAYFGIVFYPGAIALVVLLLLLLAAAPWRASLRLSPGASISLIALLMLGGWTLLSMLWSPAPGEALSDGARVLLYALSFVLGLWLVHLLAGRPLLSLLPLAAAGGIAAVATAITLVTGEDLERYLEIDGTLEFPIGYRNANAAFFLIAVWPALALAGSHRVDWRLRGVMLGCATLCAEIGVLTQSRGSILALLAATFVWLLLSPWRVRSLAWLVLALVPAAVALPWLLDVYQSFNADEPTLATLGDAGWAMIATSAAAVVLGAAFARLEPEPGDSRALARPLLAPLAAGAGAVVLATLAVFLAAGEDPVDFVNQRVAEVREAKTPRLSSEATRFSVSAGSTRSELWRVAWKDARENPVLGEGAGGFEYSYLRDRRIDTTVRDAHSVEMELASELGFPGVAMFAAVVIGAAAAGLRSRRLDPGSATLAAAALAAGAYWLVHTSIDWFWTFPGLTAPVFGLLGSAAAPAALDPRRLGPRPGRVAVAVVAIIAAVATVPLYLSERYTRDAYSHWRSDLQRAYSDLDRAADLNPFAHEPLLAEGAIAREARDRERAAKAFRAAIERTPDEWASHYLLGRVLERDDPDRAEREFAIAAALNPRSDVVRGALSEVRERVRRAE
jgi:hypothetical protein